MEGERFENIIEAALPNDAVSQHSPCTKLAEILFKLVYKIFFYMILLADGKIFKNESIGIKLFFCIVINF